MIVRDVFWVSILMSCVVFVFSFLDAYTHFISFEVRVQLLRCGRVGCILGEYAIVMNGAWVFMLGCVY